MALIMALLALHIPLLHLHITYITITYVLGSTVLGIGGKVTDFQSLVFMPSCS